MSYIPRLKREYKETVISNLKKEFEYNNIMQVPRLEKIVISKGVGEAVNDKKLIDHAMEEITNISGQKAIATMSKKDVASFKLRKGMPIGVKVTLRGERMYEFLDRLVTAALPRVRDFTGVKVTGFDGRGNYNLGVIEQIIFPEINIDKINKISGMDITFVTNANSDKEALSLLRELGLPFKKVDERSKSSEIKEIKQEAPAEDAVVEEAPTEDTVVEEAPAEDTVAEEAPAEEVVAEEAPAEDAVAEEAPAEDTVVEEAPAEDTVVEEAPAEEVVVEEAPAEEVVAEEAPAEESSKDESEETNKDEENNKKKK